MSNLSINNTDPTRTKGIRRAFTAEVNKRFRWLRGRVREAVVDLDVFGLKENVDLDDLSMPHRRAFDFPRSREKVQEFMDWLKKMEDEGILEVSIGRTRQTATEVEWANKYIDHSYKQGIRRAMQEMNNAGYTVGEPTDDMINFAFSRPVHADAVGLLYTRVFSELTGVTNAMDQVISRVLAEGLARGANPYEIASNMTDEIHTMQKKRARAIARTEVIRAHHQATINTYQEASIEGVKIKAEWSTAGDRRVCQVCLAMEQNSPYTLEEIRPLIPNHPNCRCVALPLTEGEEMIQQG